MSDHLGHWATDREPKHRYVSVSRGQADPCFGIWIALAEFVREEPLESRLRSGVDAAVRAVPGITEVFEEDREVWSAEGLASGQAILDAIRSVVDPIVDDYEQSTTRL